MQGLRMLVLPVSCFAIAIGVADPALSAKSPCNPSAKVTISPQPSARATYAEAEGRRSNDNACAIDAKMLLERKDSLVLVDVRLPSVFRTVWIPGSANLSADAIGASALVRGARDVVLVGDGRNTADLMLRCGAMRKRGLAQIHVLSGGIAAWHRAGGPISGNTASLDRPIELDGETLRQTLGDAQASLIFGGVGTGKELAGLRRRIILAKTGIAAETVLSRVPNNIAMKHATVVFVARDEDIERWRAAARSMKRPEPLFYVGEGARYDAYIAEQSSIAAHAYEPLPSRCERS